MNWGSKWDEKEAQTGNWLVLPTSLRLRLQGSAWKVKDGGEQNSRVGSLDSSFHNNLLGK